MLRKMPIQDVLGESLATSPNTTDVIRWSSTDAPALACGGFYTQRLPSRLQAFDGVGWVGAGDGWRLRPS